MTQRVNIVATLAFLVLGAVLWPGAASAAERVAAPTWAANPPQAFILPAIHPRDVKLQTKQLAPGVFALLSGTPAVDNSGFVVGRDGVLVIDAHINGAMARQIQAAVRRVTDKPILYLVNTNFHGDHTFGNYAFPATTTIIAQRGTAARMRHFEAEKEILLRAVRERPHGLRGRPPAAAGHGLR